MLYIELVKNWQIAHRFEGTILYRQCYCCRPHGGSTLILPWVAVSCAKTSLPSWQAVNLFVETCRSYKWPFHSLWKFPFSPSPPPLFNVDSSADLKPISTRISCLPTLKRGKARGGGGVAGGGRAYQQLEYLSFQHFIHWLYILYRHRIHKDGGDL